MAVVFIGLTTHCRWYPQWVIRGVCGSDDAYNGD